MLCYDCGRSAPSTTHHCPFCGAPGVFFTDPEDPDYDPQDPYYGYLRKKCFKGRDLSGLSNQEFRHLATDTCNTDLGSECHMRDFRQASLENTDLSFVDLSDSSFVGANLRGAHLCGVFFPGVLFWNACLVGADLRWANSNWPVDFSNADLTFADLRGADLRWADFRGADLRGVKFGKGFFSGEKTIFPKSKGNFTGAKNMSEELRAVLKIF